MSNKQHIQFKKKKKEKSTAEDSTVQETTDL